jgi:iron complex transport system permease protein
VAPVKPVGLRWLIAAALLALLLGIGVGSVPLGPQDIWRGLMESGGPTADIVRQLRLPRVLLAFVVGGSLGVSGAALQALVRNPLADPYLLGLSGGAGLGAVLGLAAGIASPWIMPIMAFAGAIGAIAVVYRLSLVQGHRLDPRILLLAGVVVGSFAAAIMTGIISLSDATQLRNAFLWLLGGFGGASWPALATYTVYAVLPLLLLFRSSRALDLLALGEEPARHLGLDAERTKRIVYLSAGLLTAAAVSVCGIIGFVGLVVPHIMRRLVGPIHRVLLPAVFVGSGTFLVLSDVVARSAVRPLELPVGVVTALIGVPLFAVLLRRTLA